MLLTIVGVALPATLRADAVRRVFEPQDLEFADPGSFEQDFSIGLIRGDDGYRLSLPDFEITLGISDSLEIGIDGESAIGGPEDGSLALNHNDPDNIWTSFKYGLIDYDNQDDSDDWALGVQFGPKFPVAPDAQGVGVEGLLLLGWRYRQLHLVFNAGGLRDPGGGGDAPRPSGPEFGVDVDWPLDDAGHWDIGGGIGAVLYTSSDPKQTTLQGSLNWSPVDAVTFSVGGLYGLLSGGDQYGVILGVAPKLRLW